MVKPGTLYLIPTLLAPDTEQAVLPPTIRETCSSLDYYLVENVRSARRFLSKLKIGKAIEDLEFQELERAMEFETLMDHLLPVVNGQDAGILSEAGCPAIADPGAEVVEAAHQLQIPVMPLVGPSSILLALMGSGMNGQSFAFNGYLPIKNNERQQRIRQLEKLARQSQQTQIFMETPYRNEKLLADILKVCKADTRLCVARDVTGPQAQITTKSIEAWRKLKTKPALHKIPAIFVLG